MPLFNRTKQIDKASSPVKYDAEQDIVSEKTLYQRLWPVFACGSGLFSDGCEFCEAKGAFSSASVASERATHQPLTMANPSFIDINNVIGSVSTVLGQIYGKRYTESSAQNNVSSIA
jgi:hypothetical protein